MKSIFKYNLYMKRKAQKVKTKKKKYYILLSKKDKFQYGVFPYSKDGLENARKYLKKDYNATRTI